MNRSIFIILFIIVLGSACKNEETPPHRKGDYITIVSKSETRTYIHDFIKWNIYWKTADEINLYVGLTDEDGEFKTYTSGTAEQNDKLKNITFTGEHTWSNETDEHRFYAYYPSDDSNPALNTVSVSLPATILQQVPDSINFGIVNALQGYGPRPGEGFSSTLTQGGNHELWLEEHGQHFAMISELQEYSTSDSEIRLSFRPVYSILKLRFSHLEDQSGSNTLSGKRFIPTKLELKATASTAPSLNFSGATIDLTDGFGGSSLDDYTVNIDYSHVSHSGMVATIEISNENGGNPYVPLPLVTSNTAEAVGGVGVLYVDKAKEVWYPIYVILPPGNYVSGTGHDFLGKLYLKELANPSKTHTVNFSIKAGGTVNSGRIYDSPVIYINRNAKQFNNPNSTNESGVDVFYFMGENDLKTIPDWE